MSSEAANGTKISWIKIKIFTKPIWTITVYLGRKSVCLENRLYKNKAGICREHRNPKNWRLEIKGKVDSCFSQKDTCMLPKTLT